MCDICKISCDRCCFELLHNIELTELSVYADANVSAVMPFTVR